MPRKSQTFPLICFFITFLISHHIANGQFSGFTGELVADVNTPKLELTVLTSSKLPATIFPKVEALFGELEKLVKLAPDKLKFTNLTIDPYTPEAVKLALEGVRPQAMIAAVPGVHRGKHYYCQLLVRAKNGRPLCVLIEPEIPLELTLVQAISGLADQGPAIPETSSGFKLLPNGEPLDSHKEYLERIQWLEDSFVSRMDAEVAKARRQMATEIADLEKQDLSRNEKIQTTNDLTNKIQARIEDVRANFKLDFEAQRIKLDVQFIDREMFVDAPKR